VAVAVLSRAAATVRLTPERTLRAVVAVSALTAMWNVLRYPPLYGYDAIWHERYADFLVHHHALPTRADTLEYYSPPLYYALAGAADWLGGQMGMGDPHRLAVALNVPCVVASALLAAATARLLWPRRRWLATAAGGFVALSPVLLRIAAMFQPEPLDLALQTLSLYLAARILVHRRYGARAALGLGLALGAAQMVRQFALWALATVVLAWLAALWARPRERPELVRSLAVALAAVVVVAGPWYAWRAQTYGNAVFDRPHSSQPLWERRPASFYVDPGLRSVFTRPYRPHDVNLLWPQTYSDVWGDWYGVFAWRALDGRPTASQNRWLVVQNVVGILPTALALAGWLALLVGAALRRDGPRLLPALLPLAALAGYLFFTVGYPTPDGDVIKAVYVLASLGGWAICFGRAAVAAADRAPRLVGAVLGLLALVDLPFLVYRL
jgi:hypothetical protein